MWQGDGGFATQIAFIAPAPNRIDINYVQPKSTD
jgi:hypothetical protein